MKYILSLLVFVSSFVNAQDYRSDVVVFDSVSKIAGYYGGSKIIYVKDSINGGTFVLYQGGLPADGKNIISGSNSSKWKRDFPQTIRQMSSYAALRSLISSSLSENYTYSVYYNGVLSYFRYDATDNSTADDTAMTIVGGSGARFKRLVGKETLDARWFGANGSDVTDDWYNLQRCINYAIYNNYKRVYISGGTYYLSKGLVIWKDTNNDGLPEFVNISIEGNISAYRGSSENETVLYANNRNSFALGIQWGKGVSVKNINFKGTNQISYTNAQAWNDSTTYLLDSQRTNKYSPYAGIVIDPFGSPVADSIRYPGFLTYYNSSKGTTGSTDCKFENIQVDGFVVGIVISPNGNTQNGESLLFSGVWIKNCRDGFATCNSQERQTLVRNLKAWEDVRTVFTNKGYGAENGVAPDIDGVNIAGNIKEAFYINNSWSNINIKNVYAESIYRIGTISGFNAVISDSYFDLASAQVYGLKYADWILNSPAGVSINNSTIYYYNGGYRAPLNVLGYVNFNSCLLSQPVGTFYNQWSFPNPNVTYSKCGFYSIGGMQEEYLHSVYDNAKYFNAKLVKPGYKYSNYGNSEYASQFREVKSPLIKNISLGSVSVTLVNKDTARAVIPALAKKTQYVGSIVYENVEDNTKGGQLMVINSINDTGLVIFTKAINRVITGTYTLNIELYQNIGYGLSPVLFNFNNSNTIKFSNMIQEGTLSAFTPSKATTYYLNRIPVVFDTVVSGGGTHNNNLGSLLANTVMNRGVLSSYSYDEWGMSYGNPATNSLFTDGVLFTENSVYKNTKSSDSAILEYKCIKSGIKGSSMPPEFEIVYKSRQAGAGYKLGILNSNQVKSLTAGYGLIIDSATSNQVNYKVDTTALFSNLVAKFDYEGVYTPTKYIITNIDSASFTSCSYQRIGNFVYVYGEIYVDPTNSNQDTQVDISLPISTAINYTYSLAGNGSAHQVAEAMRIYGNTTNYRAIMRFKSSDNAGHVFSFSFTYKLDTPN